MRRVAVMTLRVLVLSPLILSMSPLAVADESGSGSSCSTPSGSSCVTGAAANRCADYGACSLYGDLATAGKERLKMYAREKAQDGATYVDMAMFDFEGIDLNGNAVRSADLAGRPTLLVFLAGHCGHSIDSIGILKNVAARHKDQGVEVVGVFVDSGAPQQVKTLANLYKADYPIWMYPDNSIGDVIDSHLVPTYFCVDAKGSVKGKLVGMKTEKELSTFLKNHVTGE